MNCLLIYPEMPDTFYAMKHFIALTGKKAAFPPLGLMTVAAMLPEEWQLKIIDRNVEPLTDAQLAWSDLAFVSAMNVQEESVRDIIAQCKQAQCTLVAGGPLFTHEYERFVEIDHFVLNEAEITLPRFLADLEQGTPKRLYKSPEFADVTLSPLPRYDLVDMRNYLYAIVQYSRGCPYLCDFCDVTTLFGRKPRTKTPEQIIVELNLIRQHSRSNLVLFADDNLIGNKRVLKSELLPALIEWQRATAYGFYFATQVTINLADDAELMRMMADAGFRSLFVGIETPQEDSLKDSRKIQNLKRDLLETIRLLHLKGFTIYGGFILGFDTDTSASFENMRDFIQQSGIPMPIVNILKAPPGTELFTRMKNEGRLVKDFAFEEGDTNIRTAMAEQELLEGFLYVIDGIYAPENALNRIKNYLGDHRYTGSEVRIKSYFGATELLTGLQIVFRLGFVSPSRRVFWKLMAWTWKHHRKFLDAAVINALHIHQMHLTAQGLEAEARQRLAELQYTSPTSAAERIQQLPQD